MAGLSNQIPGLDGVPYPSPAAPATADGFDMNAFLRMMFGGGMGTNNNGNLAELAKIIRPPDVQGEYNKKMGLPGAAWDAGFFGARPGTPEFSGRTTPLDMSAAAKAPAIGNQWDGGAGALAASPLSFLPSPGVPQTSPKPPMNPTEEEMQQMLAQNRAFAKGPTGFSWSRIGKR